MSEEQHQEDRTPGTFFWHELLISNKQAITEFYSKLFGWTHEDMDISGFTYRLFKKREPSVGGMMEITPEMGNCPSHWMGPT